MRRKPEEGHPGVVDSSWQNPYYNYQAPGLFRLVVTFLPAHSKFILIFLKTTGMHGAAMGQVREQALEHVLETLCTTSKDVQSCLLLASTSKSLNKLVGEGSCWRRFFAEVFRCGGRMHAGQC